MKTERNPGSHVFQLYMIQRKKAPRKTVKDDLCRVFKNFQYRRIYSSHLDIKKMKQLYNKR